jgi:hypothetical protein
MIEVILKRFEAPDETRLMEKGKFEVVRLGRLTVGRATYEPGSPGRRLVWRRLRVIPQPM